MKKLGPWIAASIILAAVGAAILSSGAGGCGNGGNVVFPDDDFDDDAADDDAGPATVTIVDFAFQPNSVTIGVGETVTWINDGSVDHHVESGNPGDPTAGSVFDSGVLAPGASFSFTFNQSGSYVYFCAIHPMQMHGAYVLVQ